MTENTDLVKLINDKFTETNGKLSSIQATLTEDIAAIREKVDSSSSRIDRVEEDLRSIKNDANALNDLRMDIEMLKQDRLRNNLRLTGLPQQAFENPNSTIIQIEAVLKLGLIPSDFVAYADRHGTSLILSFGNYAHKRLFTNELQRRRGLLVEEVFPTIKSNSAVYANDQLTPYYAKLFQIAWQAKKNGSLHSASSLGGRIKVKVSESSQIVVIETEQQINDLLNARQAEAQSQQIDMASDSRNITTTKTVIATIQVV